MLQLTRLKGGGFDLAADTSQDATEATAAMVQTVAYAVLLTDAQAPERVEPDIFAARGWWADPSAGTGLWYVRRQALDDKARAQATRMVQTALAQRAEFQSVAVTAVTDTSPDGASGNVSQVSLSVSGKHNGKEFLIDVPI